MQLWDAAPHGRDPAETSSSLMWFILQNEGFPIAPVRREQKNLSPRNTGARETWHKALAQRGWGCQVMGVLKVDTVMVPSVVPAAL